MVRNPGLFGVHALRFDVCCFLLLCLGKFSSLLVLLKQ